MGAGYNRQDTTNKIANGETTDAAVVDSEFDALEAAFHASTGHTHDGTATEGGPITLMGPAQDFVVSATEIKPKTTNTLDIGTTSLRFKDAYLQGDITLGTIVFSDNTGTLEITGNGSISGTLDITGAITGAAGITATGVIDFSGATSVAVPNSTTGGHALNVTTADARYVAIGATFLQSDQNETITGDWTFSGAVVVPDSTTSTHALNVNTADSRYVRESSSDVSPLILDDDTLTSGTTSTFSVTGNSTGYTKYFFHSVKPSSDANLTINFYDSDGASWGSAVNITPSAVESAGSGPDAGVCGMVEVFTDYAAFANNNVLAGVFWKLSYVNSSGSNIASISGTAFESNGRITQVRFGWDTAATFAGGRITQYGKDII